MNEEELNAEVRSRARDLVRDPVCVRLEVLADLVKINNDKLSLILAKLEPYSKGKTNE